MNDALTRSYLCHGFNVTRAVLPIHGNHIVSKLSYDFSNSWRSDSTEVAEERSDLSIVSVFDGFSESVGLKQRWGSICYHPFRLEIGMIDRRKSRTGLRMTVCSPVCSPVCSHCENVKNER